MDPTSITGSGSDVFLRNLNVRSSQLRERAEQMQAELEAILETVQSADGSATVTVGSGGIMRDIAVGAASSRVTPQQLNRAIMTAYQQACRLAAEKAADIMERYAPGSPAVAMMRDAIPPDPEESPEYVR